MGRPRPAVTPLRIIRETLGIPRDEIPNRIGVGRYELARVEGGSRPVSAVNIRKIALLLGAEPADLGAGQCACGCGQLAAPGREFRWGHNSEGEAIARGWHNRRRRKGWLLEFKRCRGCDQLMVRAHPQLQHLSDAKSDARRTCSRRCSNAAWRRRCDF